MEVSLMNCKVLQFHVYRSILSKIIVKVQFFSGKHRRKQKQEWQTVLKKCFKDLYQAVNSSQE